MRFGFPFLKQSLFDEKVIPERTCAYEKRLARRRRKADAMSEGAPPTETTP